MKNRKQLLVLLFLVVIGVLGTRYLLRDSPPEPPAAYRIGEDSIPSFDQQLEGRKLSSITISPQGADETSPDVSFIYTYTDLNLPGKFTEQYVQSLTGEDEGFSVVDETLTAVTPPDFSLLEGTILLVRPSCIEGRLFEIGISWSGDGCVITVSQPEGVLSNPVKPILLAEAIQYFRSLNPSSLGMSGTSMADYQVYPIDGLVFVDGNACIKMSVYQATGPDQMGQVQGIYLITGDKSHIYHLDPNTNMICEVTPYS